MGISDLTFGIEPINKKENVFGDDIAFVEQYDFSRANMSEESRIHAISAVASICYQNPKALNSESLYNRLKAESMGLPSSSFEFVPVLISADEFANWCYINTSFTDNNPLTKYGEWILDGQYLLTNFRAVIYLKENFKMDFTKHFNTEFECEIIKQHFKVFNYKVDLPTRSQMVRHRCSWQELSRRYVSGSRVPFEFYVSEKMKDVRSKTIYYGSLGERTLTISTQNIIDSCLNHYVQALKDGVKPQEARRIIPQAAYTQIWGAFMPNQLDNYFKLRLDEHSQWEIRQTAIAMQELIQGDKE